MWNSFELHIPLNGCKGTNFSAIFQTFPHFSYKNCKKSHRHRHRSPFPSGEGWGEASFNQSQRDA